MTRTARRWPARLFGVLALTVLAVNTVPAPPTGSGAGVTPLRLAAAPAATPGPVSIATVPAVAGFPVTLDGVTEYTDGAGKAHMETGRGPDLEKRISLSQSLRLMIEGQQVLVRPARIYASDRVVQIAVDLDYFVRFHFSNTEGTELDGSKIDTVVVKSETGEIVRVPAAEGSWLQANRVLGGSGAPRVRHLAWSVQEIRYAGANVVNASQQRFVPAEQQDVGVELLFFGMAVHMRDAFFGFAQSGSVDLEYPDGSTQRFPLGKDGVLTIPALPRGEYTLTPVGPGPRMSRPLAISRTQNVDLSFYSWLDIVSVVLLVVGVAGGLAWAGAKRRGPRPPRRRHPGRRSGRPGGEDTVGAAPGERRAAGHPTESSSDDAVPVDRGAG
jgi:hypothetical protein